MLRTEERPAIAGPAPSLERAVLPAERPHCQKETARLTVEKGGEYFQPVKGDLPAWRSMPNGEPTGTPPFVQSGSGHG